MLLVAYAAAMALLGIDWLLEADAFADVWLRATAIGTGTSPSSSRRTTSPAVRSTWAIRPSTGAVVAAANSAGTKGQSTATVPVVDHPAPQLHRLPGAGHHRVDLVEQDAHPLGGGPGTVPGFAGYVAELEVAADASGPPDDAVLTEVVAAAFAFWDMALS